MDRTTRGRFPRANGAGLTTLYEEPERNTTQSGVGTRLHGRWLLLARVAWVAMAGLTLGIFVASIVVALAQVQTLCQTAACGTERLTPDQLRVLQQLGVPPSAYRGLLQALGHVSLTFVSYVWLTLGLDIAGVLVYSAVAVLIFWRRSYDRLGLFVSLTLLTFGVATYPPVFSALAQAYPIWWLPTALIGFLGAVGIGLFFLVFPDGRFVPRWTRWAAVAWIAAQALGYLTTPPSPLTAPNWLLALALAVQAAFLGIALYAQVYRYRRESSAKQRIQTKWVVFGLAVALLTLIGASLALAVLLPGTAIYSASQVVASLVGSAMVRLGFLFIPITIGIAVLRHKLFDIDLIIKQTLVYTVLVATLLVLYEVGATVFEHVLIALTGQSSLTANVAVSFFVGALAGPLRAHIQVLINRLVFPRKYEADRQIEAFSKQLRHALDAETMPEQVGEELMERIQRIWAAARHRTTDAGTYSTYKSTYQQGRLFP